MFIGTAKNCLKYRFCTFLNKEACKGQENPTIYGKICQNLFKYLPEIFGSCWGPSGDNAPRPPPTRTSILIDLGLIIDKYRSEKRVQGQGAYNK